MPPPAAQPALIFTNLSSTSLLSNHPDADLTSTCAAIHIPPMLNLRDPRSCHYDLRSLGECMVRLSPPGHGRLEFANILEVWVGGGEYNVAYALARLKLRTGFISRLVDNPVGRIILNHARTVG